MSALEPSASIPSEAHSLIHELQLMGWIVERVVDEGAQYFGNWCVDMRRGGMLRLVRDRGQYFVGNMPREELEAAGLWKAWSSLGELEAALLAWLNTGPNNDLFEVSYGWLVPTVHSGPALV